MLAKLILLFFAAQSVIAANLTIPNYDFVKLENNQKIYQNKKTQTVLSIHRLESSEDIDRTSAQLGEFYDVRRPASQTLSYKIIKNGVHSRTFLFFDKKILQISFIANKDIDETEAFNQALEIKKLNP